MIQSYNAETKLLAIKNIDQELTNSGIFIQHSARLRYNAKSYVVQVFNPDGILILCGLTLDTDSVTLYTAITLGMTEYENRPIVSSVFLLLDN